MIYVFSTVRGLIKFDEVCIDNNTFRLHYKMAVIILLLSSTLLTARQYFGDPIDCIFDDANSNVMDTYCWIYSTYTVFNKLNGQEGLDFIKPGVTSHIEGEDEVKYHDYYQWMCFILFIQSVFFYIPRYFWKNWEGGRMRMLVVTNNPLTNDDTNSESKNIVEYFYNNLHTQNSYILRFIFCEFLNLINVIGQLFFMDWILEGEFKTYGIEVLGFMDLKPENRVDPMDKVFPKITKCAFKKYGPSGDIQSYDGLCILPQNIINEKICVCIWFLFINIAVISFCNFLYRIFTIMVPRLRLMLLQSCSRLTPSKAVKTVNKHCQIGSWFVLYQLSKNTDPKIFKMILVELANKLDSRQSI